MTADYSSEMCTMRQLSTLFKMQSVHIVDYEGHLPILHASLLIWAGNWKSQRRTKKQKKRQIQETVSSFVFRVQSTHRYITAAYEPDKYCILKNRQTTNLGTKQSLFSSQERSVMLTGKKKIVNLGGKEFFTSKFKTDFPALVLFPMVSPQGVISGGSGNVFTTILLP